MRRVMDRNGKEIGKFEGEFITNNDKRIYWVTEGEVFVPVNQDDQNLVIAHKKQFALVGKLKEDSYYEGAELIFTILA